LIFELKQPARGLLSVDTPFPEALAVIQGNNPGWIFVDDTNAPRTGLVWAGGIEGFYLVGEPGNTFFISALYGYIERAIAPRLKDMGLTWFEVSGGERWDPVIERVFENRKLEISQQWVYTLPPTGRQVPMQPAMVGKCELLSIDRRLLARLSPGNAAFLRSKLESFWGSQEAFLRAGLGCLLLREGEIASLCFSGFVAGDTHAIDVETRASQRRRGYAEAVARAFIAECIARDFQPYWDCMAENLASAQLAQKLGFTRRSMYNLYSFPL
jgi:RimJ/RimL family protein N-acetyltransferase